MTQAEPKAEERLPFFRLWNDCVCSRVIFYACFFTYFIMYMVLTASLVGHLEVDGERLDATYNPDMLFKYYLIVLAIRELLFGRWRLRTVMGALVFGTLIVAAWYIEWMLVCNALLFAFCARDLDFINFSTFAFVICGILLVGIAALSQVGVVENLISDLDDTGERHRFYLGFRHPNSCGLLTFAMVTAGIYARGKKYSFPDAAAMVAVTVVIYVLIGCRTMLVANIFCALSALIAVKWAAPNWFIRTGKVVWALVPIGLMAGMLALCNAYDPDIAWVEQINALISGRIYFGAWAMQVNGLHMMPGAIELPNIASVVIADGQLTDRNVPIPLDCHYVLFPLRMGMLLTILYTALLAAYGWKSWDRDNPALAIIVLAIFFYLVMETTAFACCRNPMMLTLGIVFAYPSLDALQAKREKKLARERERTHQTTIQQEQSPAEDLLP